MGKRVPKPKDPEMKTAIINERFNKVRELMLQGVPKYKACKKLGFDSHWLLDNFTVEQKKTLKEISRRFACGHFSGDLFLDIDIEE